MLLLLLGKRKGEKEKGGERKGAGEGRKRTVIRLLES